MKRLTYTQHSVAWPILADYLGQQRLVDELNVQLEGGSSITFDWVSLGPAFPHGALRVDAFSAAFDVLLDPRIVSVLSTLRRKRQRSRDIPPAALIALLEEQGALASEYHLRGQLDSPMTPHAERERIARALDLVRGL